MGLSSVLHPLSSTLTTCESTMPGQKVILTLFAASKLPMTTLQHSQSVFVCSLVTHTDVLLPILQRVFLTPSMARILSNQFNSLVPVIVVKLLRFTSTTQTAVLSIQQMLVLVLVSQTKTVMLKEPVFVMMYIFHLATIPKSTLAITHQTPSILAVPMHLLPVCRIVLKGGITYPISSSKSIGISTIISTSGLLELEKYHGDLLKVILLGLAFTWISSPVGTHLIYKL